MANLGRIFKETRSTRDIASCSARWGPIRPRVDRNPARTEGTMEWNDVGDLRGAGAIMEEVVREIARKAASSST